jgi:hypothetical protein
MKINKEREMYSDEERNTKKEETQKDMEVERHRQTQRA